MVVSLFLPLQILNYNLSGWAWLTILSTSILRLLRRNTRVSLPLWFWTPWALWVLVYGFSGKEFSWQSTAQILCPLVAGAAASTYKLSLCQLEQIGNWLLGTFGLYWVLFACLVVVPSTADSRYVGFPSGAIAALFFQAVFLSWFAYRKRRLLYLALYVLAVLVPALIATRGPLLASLVLVILAPLQVSLRRRVVIVLFAALIAAFAFNSARFQQKMFNSGSGRLSDLSLSNPNLNSDGRMKLWQSLLSGITEEPWLGHGGNADREWLLDRGNATYLPHNDWLRILFNYGLVGTLLYIYGLVRQFVHVIRAAQKVPDMIGLWGRAGACALVGYVVVMLTDNALIYCQAITVPIMMSLGAFYASRREYVKIFGVEAPAFRGAHPGSD